MVVVAAGGDERGLLAVALHEVEAQYAAIEAEGALEVGHLQVDVADARARSHRAMLGGIELRRLRCLGHDHPSWG